MTLRAGLLVLLVSALVLALTLTTYGEQPSGVGWRFSVPAADWVDVDPYALLAKLHVSQVGHEPARDVRLWIRYPAELFELTDLHPSPTGWLPFLGGQVIRRWDPGRTYALEFGFRYDRRSRSRIIQLLRHIELRVEWTENGERRAQVVPLPEVPAPGSMADGLG